MVVRLKDLNNDKQTTNSAAPSSKQGLVRLSDLNNSSTVKSSVATPILSDNARGMAEMDESQMINKSRESQSLANDFYKQQETMQAEDNPAHFETDRNAMLGVKARNLPVLKQLYTGFNIPGIGHVGGLDDFATNPTVDKAADIARSFYLPGAGVANVAGLTSAAESGLAKYLPSFAESTAGKITSKFALPGIPLGAGATVQNDPNASVGKVALGALEGAAFGGGLGALGTAAGKGLTRLADIAPDLARNAIKNVAANSRTVATPFAEDAALGNPIARGYTENVGNSFSNKPITRDERITRVDDLLSNLENKSRGNQVVHDTAPRVIPTSPEGNIASNTEQLSGRTIGAPVRQQEPQIGTRSNALNQLENGNFSDELNSMIRNADNSYEQATNVSSVAKANENLKNLPEAESKFLLNESGGPDHIATGYRLMQELDAVGEHGRALVVSQKLAQDLTKSGQTSQAASILSRLSPEGQLLNLVRTAERNGKTVTEADSVKYKQLAGEVQQKSGAGVHSNQFNEILDRIERGEKVSPNDMINLANFLSRAEKSVKPKPIKPSVLKQPKVAKEASADDLPVELKQPKKREKVISFFDDAEQAALARIAARKNNLNSLPLPEWRDHAIVVASQIAKGTIKAATHAEDLVRLFGEEIRPVATQVFQSAQSMLKGVSRSAASDKLERAQQALHKLSGAAEEEKAAVKIMGDHVKKLIADAKAGKLEPNEVQKLRDYSDEISEMLAKKPPRKLPTEEDKFLNSVKSLAKKISEVDEGTITPDQATKEISNLIRQVTKITGDEVPRLKPDKELSNALSDIAHDVMKKTRPTPKPTTLQEKIVEKFLKQKDKEGRTVSESDIANLRQLAKDVTRLSTDQKVDADNAMQKILNSYEKSSAWDKLLAIRYMAMLLNSGTQAINAISGPVMSTTGYAADVLGTMIDVVMNKALKTPRTTTLYGSNPLQFMARYVKNLKVGAKAGWHGVNPAGIQSTNEIRGLAFKSPYNPFGLAERSLGVVAKGPDYATYKSVFDSEIVKQGFLDAKNNGIKGKANIQSHIEKFVNNPTEEAILQADRIGKNTTFQRSDTTGGKVANFLNSSPNAIKPAVNAIFPFVRTPINIASTAVTLTPAGIVKGLYQLTSKSPATQREAIRTLSLGLTGSAGIGSLGYYLNQIGVITGANDSGDKDVDNIREQAGKGKYRFNTSALSRYLEAMFNGEGSEAAEKAAKYRKGDSAFDYNKLQPLAFPAAIGASLSENKDKPLTDRVTQAGSDAFGSLYGMSTLKGVQDVFQPSYGGTVGEKALGAPMRIAESFFKSFSPSALAQEARREDPIQRKTPFNDGLIPDVKAYFQSRTPGLSQSLPPNKTTLGISKQNAPAVRGQYVNPYKSEVAPYTEAAAIISELIDRTGDLSLAPSAPDKKVLGKDRKGVSQNISIPAERYAKLQEEVGNEIIKKVSALSPTLSDAKKAEKIKDIYSTARENGRNKVKKEFGLH